MVQLNWNIPSISSGSLMDHECCIKFEFWMSFPRIRVHILSASCLLEVQSDDRKGEIGIAKENKNEFQVFVPHLWDGKVKTDIMSKLSFSLWCICTSSSCDL